MAFQNPQPSQGEDSESPMMAYSAFEFLLVELVPMTYRIQAEKAERHQVILGKKQPMEINDTYEGFEDVDMSDEAGVQAKHVELEKERAKREDVDKQLSKGFGIGGIGGNVQGQEEDETRTRVRQALMDQGARVGKGLVERFSRDKPRFQDTLDAIKFLCKDLWVIIFKKQIDNLKTNHRGIYVLSDMKFTPLGKMSLERGREGMMQQAQPFLDFPAGIIAGALKSMGIDATVHAETSDLRSATFQIKTAGARP